MFYDYNGLKIYYERHGEGEKIILLNGLMMSTQSWLGFVDSLSKNHELILIDFIDQGRSGEAKEQYTINDQAKMLASFIKDNELGKVNIVGISYGAQVGLTLATLEEELIENLMVFNCSHRTSKWLHDIGIGWKAIDHIPEGYYLNTIPWIYSPEFYNSKEESMDKRREFLVNNIFNNKDFITRLKRLTTSSEGYDVTNGLKNVDTRTLIVSGMQDYLVPKEEQDTVHALMKNSMQVYLPNIGHASMYENPQLFVTLILGFLQSSGIADIL